MAVPTVVATFDLADDSEASEHINIDVTGNKYWWHFDYKGEDFQTSQDMYIPAGEKVYLNMLASDVQPAFWASSMSGRMDVNTENVTTRYIDTYPGGGYGGTCAELC